MAAINWLDPAMSGGLFEKIVACLLLNAHEHAVRITPASGDGGVDIFVPVGDGQIDVYQCKHFSGNIRWDQVTKSLKRLEEGTWLGREVRRWHLVLAKQPTRNTLRTFDEKTSAYEDMFDCHWFGEDQLAALAMGNPAVIEYYLGNGRERLDQRIRDYQNVAELFERAATDEPPTVEMLRNRLSELAESLCRDDPHLRYGLGVEPVRPLPPPSHPDLLMRTVVPVGDWFVTRSVYLRYRGAYADAADRLAFTLQTTNEAAGARLEEMIRYGGLPVDFAESDGLSVKWPDIAGDVGEVLGMRLSPAVDRSAAALRVRFRLASGAGKTYTFRRSALAHGLDGSTSWWISPGGKMRLAVRTRRDQGRVDLRFEQAEDLENPPVHEFAEDLDLLRSLSSATEMSLAPTGSNSWSEAISPDPEIAPVHLPMLLTALLVIQEWTADTVTIPDGLTRGQLRQLVHDAALVAGVYVTTNILGSAPTTKIPITELDRSDLWNVGETLALTYQHSEPVTSLELPHMSVELSQPFLRHDLFRSLRVADVGLDLPNSIATITYEPAMYPFLMRLGVLTAELKPDDDLDLVELLGHITAERSLDEVHEQLIAWLSEQ